MRATLTPARLAIGALIVWLAAAPAAAQQSEQPAAEFQSYRIPGWSFTPAIGLGVVHDTNVGLTGRSADLGETQGDSLFLVIPSGQLEYIGRRTDFSANYGGYLRRYAEVDGLDAYSYRASLDFARTMTRRVSVYVRDRYADSPTTDEVELNGIPFTRTGSQTNTMSAGANIVLSKLTSLATRYDSTWVAFDHPEDTPFLSGGWIHGIQGELARRLSPRISGGAEYSFRTVDVDRNDRNFSFQDVGGVVRFQFAPHTSASAAGGLAVLNDRNTDVIQKGPYLRLGIKHELSFATVSAGFQRQNVPTFGFGGASSSQELRADITSPMARKRVVVQGSAIWRHISPFEEQNVEMDTISLRSTVGYAVARWARIEGVYIYTRQDSFVIVGGEVDRHRVGLQFVISQPMRIR
jgi:hypothetical protein